MEEVWQLATTAVDQIRVVDRNLAGAVAILAVEVLATAAAAAVLVKIF